MSGETMLNKTGDVTSQIHAALRVPVVGVISTLIILSNVTNIAVLRRLSKIPATSRFSLINLSVSDLLLGLVSCLPSLGPAFTGTWSYGPVLCQISGIFHGVSVTMSIWNIAVVGLDRWVAITKPFKYKFWVTLQRYQALLSFLWAAAVVTFAVPVFTKPNLTYCRYSPSEVMCGMHWEYPAFCIATGLYIPVLSGVILVITTFQISAQLKKIAKKRETMTSQTETKTLFVCSFDKKAVTVLAMTSCTYFVCWGPYVTVAMVEAFLGHGETPDYLDFFVVWIANANSCLNVFIYSYTNPAFRETLLGLLSSWFKCKSLAGKVTPVESSDSVTGGTASSRNTK